MLHGRKMDFLVQVCSSCTLAEQGYTDRNRQVTNQHNHREGNRYANIRLSWVWARIISCLKRFYLTNNLNLITSSFKSKETSVGMFLENKYFFN